MTHSLKKLYHYYFHHMKLKSKFMFSHLLLALAPTLALAVFSYNQLFHIITNNTLQSLQAISEQTTATVESNISHLDTVLGSMESQDVFQAFMRMPNPAALTDTAKFQENLLSFTESTSYLAEDESVAAIRIYLDDPHYSAVCDVTDSDLYAPMIRAKGTYWNGIFSGTDRTSLFCPSSYLSPSEIQQYGELAIIHKIPTGIGAEKSHAYIALYFSQELLDSTLQKDSPFSNSVIYIMNERDSIVSTSNSTLSGLYYLPYETVPSSISSIHRFDSLQIMGERVYMGYKRIDGTDWYMITAIPAGNVFEDGRTLLFQFIALYGIVLLAGCTIALTLSNSIIRRISTIVEQMKKVRSGPPVHLNTEAGQDEIGNLIETYNYMTDEIHKLMKQQLLAANDLRISEFKALQSQINPHFLYNTLDMIKWMAKAGKSEEVSDAVQMLSRFYKLTLNKGNITVAVKEELEHVSLYVQLQNMRYSNKIHFFIDVPEEMTDYEIPKLVFQPIVENAIQHGIFEKQTKEGNIVIMGWQEETTLIFVISDDGVGIPQEKMEHLLDGARETDSSSGSNIGIYNTHRRLQLYYDTQFGLTYRSTPGVETEVEIRIPAKKFDLSVL
jgi:two-component system sensor histidine kinase YesM